MELLINKIISSFIQIILFSAIPFIFWFTTNRKKQTFFSYIGLKKFNLRNKRFLFLLTFTTFIFILLGIFILKIMKDTNLATSEFNNLKFKGLISAIIFAIFNTSLPEEIIFRGFLLKRFKTKMPFIIANLIQSILFGLLHGIIFISIIDIIKTIIIVFFTSSTAYLMGYINEKYSNGSILPSWFIHAISNIFSSVISLFCLI